MFRRPERIDPLSTAMLLGSLPWRRPRFSEPATPSSSNPLRSCDPLAVISMPCLAVTPVILPVR